MLTWDIVIGKVMRAVTADGSVYEGRIKKPLHIEGQYMVHPLFEFDEFFVKVHRSHARMDIRILVRGDDPCGSFRSLKRDCKDPRRLGRHETHQWDVLPEVTIDGKTLLEWEDVIRKSCQRVDDV